MVKNSNSNNKSVVIAAITAGLLMFVFSAGYRILAAHLEAPVNTNPISAATLQRLPLQIGDWTGQEVPLDEDIVRATDTDALINRLYTRHNGLESIICYIATGVKARDLAPHRPEVCYIGAGWTLVNKRSMEIPLNVGMELPCMILQFSRGILNTQKTVLLNYYIVDGQYCRDVSLLRSRAWQGSGTIRYVAQVQIAVTTTINLNIDSAVKLACEFASESASSISGLLNNAEENQSLGIGRSNVNNILIKGIGSD